MVSVRSSRFGLVHINILFTSVHLQRPTKIGQNMLKLEYFIVGILPLETQSSSLPARFYQSSHFLLKEVAVLAPLNNGVSLSAGIIKCQEII